jgi:hypothetical protein
MWSAQVNMIAQRILMANKLILKLIRLDNILDSWLSCTQPLEQLQSNALKKVFFIVWTVKHLSMSSKRLQTKEDKNSD